MAVLYDDGPVGKFGSGAAAVDADAIGLGGRDADTGRSGKEAKPFGPEGSEESLGGGGRGAGDAGGGGC